MTTIAVLLTVSLLIIAAVHFVWAAGSSWPARDPEALSNMVVGTPEAEAMPPQSLTLVVALLIVAAALWPLMWRGIIPYPHLIPQTIIWLGMWSLAFIFLARGVGGLLPFAGGTVEPFNRLNRLCYSPLCIILGLGFVVLVLNP